MRALLLTVLFAACGESAPTEETLTEVAEICLDGTDIVLTFNGCLSSSCDELQASSCTAALDGTALTLTGEATYLHANDQACTDDCGIVTARCAVGEVADPSVVTWEDHTGPQTGVPTCAD